MRVATHDDGDDPGPVKVAEELRDRDQRMTKQEIEALGQAMLEEHGLSEWTVRAVREEDDDGDPEDDIEGSRGRCYYEEKLIWVNIRYADDALAVRQILLHEITHALLPPSTGQGHGQEFRTKAKEIGLQVL